MQKIWSSTENFVSNFLLDHVKKQMENLMCSSSSYIQLKDFPKKKKVERKGRDVISPKIANNSLDKGVSSVLVIVVS